MKLRQRTLSMEFVAGMSFWCAVAMVKVGCLCCWKTNLYKCGIFPDFRTCVSPILEIESDRILDLPILSRPWFWYHVFWIMRLQNDLSHSKLRWSKSTNISGLIIIFPTIRFTCWAIPCLFLDKPNYHIVGDIIYICTYIYIYICHMILPLCILIDTDIDDIPIWLVIYPHCCAHTKLFPMKMFVTLPI